MLDLTVKEEARIAQLEATIERGMQTFVEVGLALMEIRDARLYRAEFGTFEEYCRERWGMASSRARQLIAAADTVRNLETVTMVTVFPATERQARPLAALPPAQQREAWERVLETAPDGKITAAHVQAVVGRMAEPNDENDDEPEPFHYEVYDEGGGQFSLTVGPDEEIAVAKVPHVSQNSGENEWYTPQPFIEAARLVMGAIDLDPASSDVANTVVDAAAYFTAQDDGLSQDWYGRVWMNPPYAQPLVSQFCAKLRDEYDAGNVTGAIVLVNNATETAWFQRIIGAASAVCFPLARVKFWAPDRITSAPLQGQAVVYLGDNPAAFIREFAAFGWCARVV